MGELPYGRKACDVPGYAECWVQFRTSGYPRKLRREWDETKGGEDTWAIVMRYVAEWSLSDVDGVAIPLPAVPERTLSVLDNAEDALVSWIVREFKQFWWIEMQMPRPNSSPPLPAT